MEVTIKKSKTFAEIFLEASDDKEFQQIKLSVAIEVPADKAFSGEVDECIGEHIEKNSASEEAEKEYYLRLKNAVGEMTIELFKNMENF